MPTMRHRRYVFLLLLAAGTARTQGLADCAAIADGATRLACYDRLAGRDVPRQEPAAAPAVEAAPVEGPGILSSFWELDEDQKRGTFRFQTYKPNFLLPLHFTERINDSPSSPTREAQAASDYMRTEAKLQLSIRTKLAQSVLLPGADIWFGYTQQSFWQVWNKSGSAPFRNTDYETELIYMVPVPETMQALPFGWRWRYGQLAIAHQSNGQTKPLSRSWNRVYAGAGLERGDMSLTVRALNRIDENSDDDNPDLTDYRGRSEAQLSWSPGLATATLMYRSTLRRLSRGALQLDMTYPVHRDEPQGLRWYLQVFSGYGETLTDYNFRQTSVGIGLAMFEF